MQQVISWGIRWGSDVSSKRMDDMGGSSTKVVPSLFVQSMMCLVPDSTQRVQQKAIVQEKDSRRGT